MKKIILLCITFLFSTSVIAKKESWSERQLRRKIERSIPPGSCVNFLGEVENTSSFFKYGKVSCQVRAEVAYPNGELKEKVFYSGSADVKFNHTTAGLYAVSIGGIPASLGVSLIFLPAAVVMTPFTPLAQKIKYAKFKKYCKRLHKFLAARMCE